MVLTARKYTPKQIVGILLRRRWFILLPVAMGLLIPWAVTGALGGILLGVLVVALLEYRNTGFTCQEDVARALMLPVLGTVNILKSEREWRSERLRRVALDVVGCLVVTAAVLLVLWRLSVQ